MRSARDDSVRASTLVVVPAFNEQDSIAAVIREIFAKLPDVDCLVVDDGSRDATSAIARAAGAMVATLPFNLGVGGAMRTGYRYAYENGYSAAVQVDADGQHDPGEVPTLMNLLGSADIVVGARFAGSGAYEVRGPRRWAMRLLAITISRIARTRLTDTTSGFRACGPRAIELFAYTYPAEYLGDTVEALVIAARSGLSIRQVGVSMRPRAGGTPSHHPVRAAVYLGRALLALLVALIRPSSSYRMGA
jgi:glycosyltransferase involved in cell wall biosynthesis